MNSSKAIKAKAPIVQIGPGNSKQNESRRSSLVSISGDKMNGDTQDPNVFTLDLNELGGEKMENGQAQKIRINTSALRDL